LCTNAVAELCRTFFVDASPSATHDTRRRAIIVPRIPNIAEHGSLSVPSSLQSREIANISPRSRRQLSAAAAERSRPSHKGAQLVPRIRGSFLFTTEVKKIDAPL
jgi:hypothetical protein